MAHSGPKQNSLQKRKNEKRKEILPASVSRAVLQLQEPEWQAVPDLGTCGEVTGSCRAKGLGPDHSCLSSLLSGASYPVGWALHLTALGFQGVCRRKAKGYDGAWRKEVALQGSNIPHTTVAISSLPTAAS